MKSDDAMAAEQAVEAKLAEAGADQVRRHTFSDAPETAPEVGTPAEEISAEQPRNDLGQFASSDQPEEPEETIATADESGLDPSVQKYLAKYGGDKDKAIAAAVEAQRQLGRQSTEVGDLRAQNAEYEALISELQGLRSDIAQNRANQPIDQGTVDWFDQQVMQNPQGAMEWARQQGNQILMQRGLDTWKEFDPYGASSYRNDIQLATLQQQMAQERQAAVQLPVDASVNLALQNVRSKNPEYASFDEAIGTTLQRNPWLQSQLQTAAKSGDPSQLEGVIETVYGLARGDTLYNALQSGVTPDSTTTTTEVAVPATSETREAPPEPTAQDAFRASFREEAERQNKGIWVAN